MGVYLNDRAFTLISNDASGNPRYVIGYVHLLTMNERDQRSAEINGATLNRLLQIFEKYHSIASKRANRIGGRKYNTKAYRGGIVFVSFNLDETIQYIEELLTKAIKEEQS